MVKWHKKLLRRRSFNFPVKRKEMEENGQEEEAGFPSRVGVRVTPTPLCVCVCLYSVDARLDVVLTHLRRREKLLLLFFFFITSFFLFDIYFDSP